MRESWRFKRICLALGLSGISVKEKLQKARRFQYLSPNDVSIYQAGRLLELVDHFHGQHILSGRVAQQVRAVRGDLWAMLATLPLTDKAGLAALSKEISENRKSRKLVVKQTSGSSGTPVTLYKSKAGIARELAATWRSYEWAEIFVGDRGARVWGRKASKVQRLKQAPVDFLLNRFRINAFGLNEDVLVAHLHRLEKKRPAYIYGYTTIVAELARKAAELKLGPIPGLKAVVTTAEPLSSGQRQIIEQGFGVRCHDEYGCTEVGSIAHECEQGSLHLMADNLIVETLDREGKPVFGEEGELVITDLANRVTPVIRYRVGDYGVISKSPCKCGRGLPVLSSVYGRVEDLVIGPDGFQHAPALIAYIVDEIHEKWSCVKQYQVVQESPEIFSLNMVPVDSSKIKPEEVTSHFQSLLRERVHPEVVGKIDLVANIDREPSGKYRLVKRAF